ncbi:MAG: acyl-CoA dehydrogenase family protein [Acidimicrobiia bacterium]
MPDTPAPPPRIAERLSHDLFLPDETKKIRAQVRQVAETDVAPYASEIGARDESPESFPWAPFRSLAAAGLFRIPLGPEYGMGLGYRALAAATAVEELAYVCSSVATVYDGQCILAGRTIEHGTQRVRDEYLAPLSTGDAVASFATTEPDASTDLSPGALQTVAERTSAGWVISGRKRFITNAPVADFVAALCRTGDRASFLLIPLKDTPGVTVGAPDKKLGQRGQLTADIVLDRVELPEDHLLGEEGQGLKIALSVLTYSRVAIGAAGVALAQCALDLAVEHLSRRRAFGKRLGEFQHWQFRMAEHATAIECARSLYQKAALRIDIGTASAGPVGGAGAPTDTAMSRQAKSHDQSDSFPEPEAAMAKWYGTSLAVDVSRDALQALGGYGYMREQAATGEGSKHEEIYRDAKIGEIYEGANEIQKWIIARSIFGRDITG